MAKSAKYKHATTIEYDKRHTSVGSYDGGKCFVGHLFKHTPNDSCSYRWQGIKRAKESPAPYTTYAAELGKGFGLLATKDNSKIYGFTTGWFPWINAVHHVLPVGVLKDAITSFSKGLSDLEILIVVGLLNEKYNINFKVNMIILPANFETSRTVGLPTHAQGDNHSKYSDKIKEDVTDALDAVYGSVRSQMSSSSEDHDLPDHEDLKDQLRGISDDYYGKIVAYGKSLQSQQPNDGSDMDSSLNAMVQSF